MDFLFVCMILKLHTAALSSLYNLLCSFRPVCWTSLTSSLLLLRSPVFVNKLTLLLWRRSHSSWSWLSNELWRHGNRTCWCSTFHGFFGSSVHLQESTPSLVATTLRPSFEKPPHQTHFLQMGNFLPEISHTCRSRYSGQTNLNIRHMPVAALWAAFCK